MKIKKDKKNNAFFFIAIFIAIIYSNTLNASWHFDDEPNILLNSSLHLEDLNLTSISRVFDSFFSDSGFYRPVSCFTFALNWYFGQDNPTGYHIVNIIIHIITAFFLFLVLLQIMQLTEARKEENSKHHFIALLGALFWAAAPIQTQAVTYIVQRMASMSAMFTILAIYSYLKARMEKNYMRFFILTFIFFLAAIGSKENAVMLPASLALLEFSFFRHHISKQKTIWMAFISLAFLLAGLLSTHFLFGGNLLNIFDPSRLIDSYAERSFTLKERILTEPRIILMYLSQIFVPLVSRLSLVHDVQVSTSLFTPWNTLPAIATILTLIILAFIFFKKYPLFSFPVLFFFLNHIVESTILPLELVFEHRNYLPSFFLFFPISFLIAQAIYKPNRLSAVGHFSISAGTVCFLILFGHATYVRNLAWANEGTLWKDATIKAPRSARAANFIGRWLKEKKEYNKAMYYYQRGLQTASFDPSPDVSKLAALSDIEAIYYDLGKYKEALIYINKGVEMKEYDQYFLTKRALLYLQLDLPQKSLHDAETLISEYPSYIIGKYIASSASYQLGDLSAAQTYMQEIIKESLDKPKGLYLMGLILLKYKRYPNALFFLKKAVNLWPNNAEYQLTLTAVYYNDGQVDIAEKTLRNIFINHPLPVIEKGLLSFTSNIQDKDAITFIKNTLAEMLAAEM